MHICPHLHCNFELGKFIDPSEYNPASIKLIGLSMHPLLEMEVTGESKVQLSATAGQITVKLTFDLVATASCHKSGTA